MLKVPAATRPISEAEYAAWMADVVPVSSSP